MICATVCTVFFSLLHISFSNIFTTEAQERIRSQTSLSVKSISSSLSVGSLKPVSKKLIYKNKPQQLFEGSAVFRGHGRVYYYAGVVGVDGPTAYNYGLLNIEDVTKTEAGTYTLFYRLGGCYIYENIGWQSTGITMTIEKAEMYVDDTSLKAKSSLKYIQGVSQTLFEGRVYTVGNAGKNIVYGISTVDSDVPMVTSMDISSLKATAIGTYRLYYQIYGNENYNSTGWIKSSVFAKISPFSPNRLINSPASVQITKITGALATHGAQILSVSNFSLTAGSVII